MKAPFYCTIHGWVTECPFRYMYCDEDLPELPQVGQTDLELFEDRESEIDNEQ